MAKRLSPEEAAALGLSTPVKQPRRLSPEEAASLGLSAPSEEAVLEGAPYLSGAWSPDVKNAEQAYNILSKYAPDFLSEIRANPQNYNLDSIINMASALKQQNAEAELKQHFGYAPEAKVPRDELMLKHRAQLAGFDPMNLPAAPSMSEAAVGAFTGGATIGLKPFYKELTAPSLEALRRSAAPQQLPSEVTTGDVETGMGGSFRAMEPEQETLYLLRQYSPETYTRIVSGDENLTQKEVNDAVNQATRKELALQEAYYPGTTFLSQLGGQVALNTGLGKVFGVKATQPWVQRGPLRAVLNPQAVLGATEGVARGETPSEKLFGGLVGGFSGAVGGAAGEYTGQALGSPRRFARGGRFEEGLPGLNLPMEGVLDVKAAKEAQADVFKLLRPAYEDKQQANLAKMIESLRQKRDKYTQAQSAYELKLNALQTQREKAARSLAEQKLDKAGYDAEMARIEKEALKEARNFEKKSAPVKTDVEKQQLVVDKLKAEAEALERSAAAFYAKMVQEQQGGIFRTYNALVDGRNANKLSPAQEAALKMYEERAFELGQAQLNRDIKAESEQRYKTEKEYNEKLLDVEQRKLAEMQRPKTFAEMLQEKPTAKPENVEAARQKLLAEAIAAGRMKGTPEAVAAETARLQTPEGLQEIYTAYPELQRKTQRLGKLQERYAQPPMTEEEIRTQAMSKLKPLESLTPAEQDVVAKDLYKGRAVFDEDRLRGGVSMGLPGVPARLYAGEAAPPLSSVGVSDLTAYKKRAIARDLAEVAKATPIAVPMSQAVARGTLQNLLTPSTDTQEDFISYLEALKKAAPLQNEEEKKKEEANFFKYLQQNP